MASAAEILSGGRVVVAAGPGLLLEAGLIPPEARGGLWDQIGVDRCAVPEALQRHPRQAYAAYHQYLTSTDQLLVRPGGPSPSHEALVSLTRAGLLRGAIVTTTDGLLRRMGLPTAEICGAIDRGRCCHCRKGETIVAWKPPPVCDVCHHLVRPDLVLFGEQLPQAPRRQAAQWVYGARALLAVGVDLGRPPLHRIVAEMRQEGGRTIAIDCKIPPNLAEAGVLLISHLRHLAEEVNG